MRTEYLTAIAVASFAAGASWAVYSVRTNSDYCPPPSAASAAALFAPCQSFDTATGHVVTKQQAVQMGLLAPDEQPAPATQLAAEEHATVGVAMPKRTH